MKNKLISEALSVSDDTCSGKFSDIQQQLDEIQNNGMSALDIKTVLFNKLLDLYQVPSEHFLRKVHTPDRIDDPSIVIKLQQLGFSKKPRYQLH